MTNRKMPKPATPSWFKTNEEIALLLAIRGCKTPTSQKVLRNIEARIETQQLLKGASK